MTDDLYGFFNKRGWIVAFPQRRGRGKSGGLYDEGFTPDRSEYSCDPEFSLPGLERALTDMDAAADYLLGISAGFVPSTWQVHTGSTIIPPSFAPGLATCRPRR